MHWSEILPLKEWYWLLTENIYYQQMKFAAEGIDYRNIDIPLIIFAIKRKYCRNITLKTLNWNVHISFVILAKCNMLMLGQNMTCQYNAKI